MPRLLLVDDDDNVRLTLAIALRRHGFEVKTAADGFAAIEMLQREAFQADAIFWRPRAAPAFRPFTAADLTALREQFRRAGNLARLGS